MERLAVALACLCLACSDAVAITEDPMPGIAPAQPVSPWHMWGSSQSVTFLVSHTGRPALQTLQLARVNYRRPESWRFFFGARITHGSAAVILAPCDIVVSFRCIVGVGRTMFQTPADVAPGTTLQIEQPIVRMQYQVPLGTVPGNQLYNTKYTTQGLTPPLDDAAVATSQLPIQVLTAQDLQCSADVTLIQPASLPDGSNFTVEVTALFAPATHIRPDWYQPQEKLGPRDDPAAAAARAVRFLGTEQGGT